DTRSLPSVAWGSAHPEGVRQRPAEELALTATAARAIGVGVVNGFTGSSVWPSPHAFPPTGPDFWDAGCADLGTRFAPILDAFEREAVNFALEVHPTEIAFDIASAE